MLEAARNTLQSFANDPLKVHEQIARLLPDEYVEYCITSSRFWDLERRAPDKYTKLLNTLNILTNVPTNFNPLIIMHIGPVSGQGLTPAALPAYTWGRWNDDIADGHETLPPGYATYEDFVQAEKKINVSGGKNVRKSFTIEFLQKRVIAKLQRFQRSGDNIREDMSVFLDAMQTEYLRRVNRTVSTSQELSQLYADSFGRPHNIMLIAFGSSARAADIPELPQIQGRMFNSERGSLEEDLPRGICYIPSEVLSVSGLSLDELMQNPYLTGVNPDIQEWRREEISDCSKLYGTLLQKSGTLDWKARLYIKGLTKKIEEEFNSQTVA